MYRCTLMDALDSPYIKKIRPKNAINEFGVKAYTSLVQTTEAFT